MLRGYMRRIIVLTFFCAGLIGAAEQVGSKILLNSASRIFPAAGMPDETIFVYEQSEEDFSKSDKTFDLKIDVKAIPAFLKNLKNENLFAQVCLFVRGKIENVTLADRNQDFCLLFKGNVPENDVFCEIRVTKSVEIDGSTKKTVRVFIKTIHRKMPISADVVYKILEAAFVDDYFINKHWGKALAAIVLGALWWQKDNFASGVPPKPPASGDGTNSKKSTHVPPANGAGDVSFAKKAIKKIKKLYPDMFGSFEPFPCDGVVWAKFKTDHRGVLVVIGRDANLKDLLDDKNQLKMDVRASLKALTGVELFFLVHEDAALKATQRTIFEKITLDLCLQGWSFPNNIEVKGSWDLDGFTGQSIKRFLSLLDYGSTLNSVGPSFLQSAVMRALAHSLALGIRVGLVVSDWKRVDRLRDHSIQFNVAGRVIGFHARAEFEETEITARMSGLDIRILRDKPLIGALKYLVQQEHVYESTYEATGTRYFDYVSSYGLCRNSKNKIVLFADGVEREFDEYEQLVYALAHELQTIASLMKHETFPVTPPPVLSTKEKLDKALKERGVNGPIGCWFDRPNAFEEVLLAEEQLSALDSKLDVLPEEVHEKLKEFMTRMKVSQDKEAKALRAFIVEPIPSEDPWAQAAYWISQMPSLSVQNFQNCEVTGLQLLESLPAEAASGKQCRILDSLSAQSRALKKSIISELPEGAKCLASETGCFVFSCRMPSGQNFILKVQDPYGYAFDRYFRQYGYERKKCNASTRRHARRVLAADFVNREFKEIGFRAPIKKLCLRQGAARAGLMDDRFVVVIEEFLQKPALAKSLPLTDEQFRARARVMSFAGTSDFHEQDGRENAWRTKAPEGSGRECDVTFLDLESPFYRGKYTYHHVMGADSRGFDANYKKNAAAMRRVRLALKVRPGEIDNYLRTRVKQACFVDKNLLTETDSERRGFQEYCFKRMFLRSYLAQLVEHGQLNQSQADKICHFWMGPDIGFLGYEDYSFKDRKERLAAGLSGDEYADLDWLEGLLGYEQEVFLPEQAKLVDVASAAAES